MACGDVDEINLLYLQLQQASGPDGHVLFFDTTFNGPRNDTNSKSARPRQSIFSYKLFLTQLNLMFMFPALFLPSPFLSGLSFCPSLPSVRANSISLGTSCVGLQEKEEEPHRVHPMSFAWESHIASSMLMGHYTLPNQSINPILYRT